jgi:hypothetical protein
LRERERLRLRERKRERKKERKRDNEGKGEGALNIVHTCIVHYFESLHQLYRFKITKVDV